MAVERDQQFATELSKMNDDEVRKQIDPSVQPRPVLRSMAVTELEKRRQRRSEELLTIKLSFGGITVRVILLIMLAGGIAAGLNWAGYLGQ